jgi:hypothetical protein
MSCGRRKFFWATKALAMEKFADVSEFWAGQAVVRYQWLCRVQLERELVNGR